jgi:hypothetical protein
MSERPSASNLPAVIGGRSGQVEVYRPGESEFDREPPIEVVIDADQIKEKIIDYLGAVLARCWVEKGLLDAIEADPHRALRHLGILLPSEIDIKVERPGKTRPRLVIYEYNQDRTFRRRICYLQLIMMAGQ